MPPGMEVDLGPGDIVLDGDPVPLKRGHSTPNFGPCIVAKRSPISATAEHLFSQPLCLSSVESTGFTQIVVSNFLKLLERA